MVTSSSLVPVALPPQPLADPSVNSLAERAQSVFIAPSFQDIWDATSLRYLMECPAKYQFKMLQGWHAPGEAIDLQFGHLVGMALEAFHRAIIEEGKSHDEALILALRALLLESWDDLADRGKLGSYRNVWRCTGTTKYKNAKGNAAKCPNSHKGVWLDAPGPATCSCGSPTSHQRRWTDTTGAKGRLAAIRVLVWYSEEMKDSPLRPVSFEADGKHRAAVELPFLVPFTAIGGIQYWLSGWWDKLAQLGEGGPAFVSDYKTTKHPLGSNYFSKWQPNVQVDVYDLVASRYSPIPVEGVMIEAIQVGTGWCRFGFRVYTRDSTQREELLVELKLWLTMAQQFARANYWPMNRSACALCEFKPACNVAPERRQLWLSQNFNRGRWNPLTRTMEEVHDESEAGVEGTATANADGNRMPDYPQYSLPAGSISGPSAGAAGASQLDPTPVGAVRHADGDRQPPPEACDTASHSIAGADVLTSPKSTGVPAP